jgi:hypothetical protein
VKALYTFEVMEEGELGFVAGDVIRLLDDQHLDWWKGIHYVKNSKKKNYTNKLSFYI